MIFLHDAHATSLEAAAVSLLPGLCSESHVTRPGYEDFSEASKNGGVSFGFMVVF